MRCPEGGRVVLAAAVLAAACAPAGAEPAIRVALRAAPADGVLRAGEVVEGDRLGVVCFAVDPPATVATTAAPAFVDELRAALGAVSILLGAVNNAAYFYPPPGVAGSTGFLVFGEPLDFPMPLTVLEIVAHEMAHGVTNFTAALGKYPASQRAGRDQRGVLGHHRHRHRVLRRGTRRRTAARGLQGRRTTSRRPAGIRADGGGSPVNCPPLPVRPCSRSGGGVGAVDEHRSSRVAVPRTDWIPAVLGSAASLRYRL